MPESEKDISEESTKEKVELQNPFSVEQTVDSRVERARQDLQRVENRMPEKPQPFTPDELRSIITEMAENQKENTKAVGKRMIVDGKTVLVEFSDNMETRTPNGKKVTKYFVTIKEPRGRGSFLPPIGGETIDEITNKLTRGNATPVASESYFRTNLPQKGVPRSGPVVEERPSPPTIKDIDLKELQQEARKIYPESLEAVIRRSNQPGGVECLINNGEPQILHNITIAEGLVTFTSTSPGEVPNFMKDGFALDGVTNRVMPQGEFYRNVKVLPPNSLPAIKSVNASPKPIPYVDPFQPRNEQPSRPNALRTGEKRANVTAEALGELFKIANQKRDGVICEMEGRTVRIFDLGENPLRGDGSRLFRIGEPSMTYNEAMNSNLMADVRMVTLNQLAGVITATLETNTGNIPKGLAEPRRKQEIRGEKAPTATAPEPAKIRSFLSRFFGKSDTGKNGPKKVR